MMGSRISHQIPENQKTYEITPFVLEIRCDTMKRIIIDLQKNPSEFEKSLLLRKANRIADLTKYGVRIAKNAYTGYALEIIIKKLEDYQFNISIEKYVIAKECIDRILVEKNNYF
jgi:hypothetical protein